MERASLRMMKDSTSLFADRHIGPPLTVEDGGNGEALYPGLYRVHVLVEEQIDHRRVVELDLVSLGVQRAALRFVLLAVRLIYQRVEFRIRVERDVASYSLVFAVQQRIQEVFGVRIIRPPFLEREGGLAFTRGLAHR